MGLVVMYLFSYLGDSTRSIFSLSPLPQGAYRPNVLIGGPVKYFLSRFPIKAFGNDKIRIDRLNNYVVIFFLVFSSLVLSQPVLAASQACIKGQCIKLEVVTTQEDKHKGLQGRQSLAEGQGMLFVFDDDDLLSFWMKDMHIAIDMVWIDSGGRIVTIRPSCKPCTADPCEIYKPAQEARYVLELPDGFCRRHQFHEGDIVEFSGLG